MNRRTLPFIFLLLGLLPMGSAFGQAEDAGWQELQSCVAILLHTEAASFESTRTFRVTLPQEQAASVRIQLVGDQLAEFQCQNFHVSADPGGRGHRMTRADGKQDRTLTYAEVRGFRRYLSLDPYWVLCHVRRDFGAFAFEATDDGRGVYDRWEMVPLADPEEQLYGVFQETVIVNLATHRVESYAVLALDPDGVPLQDLLNFYQADGSRASDTLVVTQTTQAGRRAAEQYAVDFR